MTSPAREQLDVVRTPEGKHSLEWLVGELEQQRQAGKRIVTTNGCFDLIHPGHVAFLDESRKLGDVLVVLLNTDNSVQQLKGPARPILRQEERAAILLGLRSVDYVVFFDDLLPIGALSIIRPHVHCKASDYAPSELPETATVEEFGGTTQILSHLSGYSSSQIAERVLARSATAPNQSGQLIGDSPEDVYRVLLAGSNVLRQTAWSLRTRLIETADILATAILTGHRILACGNGGSAADSQHFVAELVGRYRLERQPWSAIALTVDTSVLTAIGNDYGFDQVFSRQVSALGCPGDVLLAISTSGKSANVLNAVEVANRTGLSTIGLTGHADSALSQAVHFSLQVSATDTSLIQQAHIAVLHVLCDLLERKCCSQMSSAVGRSEEKDVAVS
ncbi:MAG TPA: SIS domain-containing protein [Pyrinomonadaceae bacterium]|nr:SIS domain-containing protein [Pyrinomonadaceae bacterium]